MNSPYATTLLTKLGVVGIAALLGGVNRFLVMPGWLASEAAGSPAHQALPRRFTRVVQVEAVVLCVALVLAVVLAATAPPTASM